MAPVYETRPITNPDGSWATEQVTVTWAEVSPDRQTITQTWESGKMVIASGKTITESHMVHVVAYDAAGNKTESDKVRFYVIHKPKEEKPAESGSLWRQQDEVIAGVDVGSIATGEERLVLPLERPRLLWRAFG
jgi:hypothetical protein